MKEFRTRRSVFLGSLFAFVYVVIISGGCATSDSKKVGQSNNLQTPQDKRITQVVVNETAGEAHVLVTGTKKLVYSAVKQPNPPAVIFYFPDTTVDANMPIDMAAAELIAEIGLTELSESGHATRLEIMLAGDAPYTIKQDENMLDIILQKSAVGTGGEVKEVSMGNKKQGEKATGSVASSTTNSDDRASVRNIEYQGEINGKSQVVVTTSRRVQYKIKRISPRWLRLILLNSDLPEGGLPKQNMGSQDGIVAAIVPVSQTDQPDETQIDIRLRETVPYLVKQDDGHLYVLFELPESGTAISETTSKPPVLVEVSGKASTVKEKAELEKTEKKEPKYTGEKIALDFFNTDIHNVFRILADISGENFAIDKDVEGRVTLSLDNPVPWDQVLDLVLKMNQLDKRRDENIIRIATLKTLKAEDVDRIAQIKAKRAEEEQADLVTEYILINYADAGKDVKPHLEAILSSNGKLSVDTRNNLLILTDVPTVIARAKEMVREIDNATPQVLIEARIVEADDSFSREIGLSWNAAWGIQADDPRAGVGPQRGFDTFGGTWGWESAIIFPFVTGNPMELGFNIAKVAGTPLALDARLRLLEINGNGKIIAAPKVLTLDSQEAVITQGQEYPYFEESESGGRTVKFKKVELKLVVTPHITPDGRVLIHLKIEKKDVFAFVENVPILNTKEAETEFLMNDRDTLVIGGIHKTTERLSEQGYPWLSKIPFLGWLFKTQNKEHDKEELLIFISPKIRQLERREIKTVTGSVG